MFALVEVVFFLLPGKTLDVFRVLFFQDPAVRVWPGRKP